MCAINGITKKDEALVAQMNERTKHRGPDGSSVYTDGTITFGHNRLAIIDTSHASDQPMQSNDGRYTIVFNGEIYNYRELREELRTQYDFKTEGDTEVLLAAYTVWGKEMFPRLRGIFAFALWDKEIETLFLARDHMGVKPVYYTTQNGVLTFSSELPAVLLSIASPKLNTESVGFYLSMEYVPAPETLVEGVYKLEAGQALIWKEGAYTTYSFLPTIPEKTPVTHDTVYETIQKAVERQMVSDRPIGAYLSGGFDSSIVAHHMTQFSPHTRTYSVDFEAVRGEEHEASKFNADALLAKETAHFFGTEHKTLTITLDMVRDSLEQVLSSMSEPVANSTAVTQYLLSDFVRKDGTIVVLGGDGGDELFGGYTRHRIAMGAYLYQKLPIPIQRLGAHMSARVGKLTTPFGTPLHRALMVKDEKKIRPFLSRDLDINVHTTAFFDAQYAKAGKAPHPLDTFMQVDRHTWLSDECFVRSDYASMAHGIELRVPFVDTDVVHMSDQISVWQKTLPHEGKRVIRSVYKKHLPPHLYGQPKRGWLSPAAKWFRDPAINTFTREVFSSEYYNGLDGFFDWDAVQTLLADHVEKRGYYLYPLWNILVLQVWAKAHGVRID